MAPGNGSRNKSSRTKKEATAVLDAERVPTKNAPPKLLPTEVSLSLRKPKPVDSFDAAVEKFADSQNPAVTFREIWDSAVRIGQQQSFGEVGVEEVEEARDTGFRKGRLLGIEEGLERGKELGKREAKSSFAEAMKNERQRGYQIGFGAGQDDQKAKEKKNDTPIVSASTQALADTSPRAKTPGNNATRVCTATTVSSTSNNATAQPPLITCSNDDMQQQPADARLEGWKAGLEEGQRRKGEEDGKKSEEVAEGGMQVGKDEENQQWTAGGHGEGLCLSMAAHSRALFCSAAFLDEAGVQTDPETTTWSDAGTRIAPRTDETAVQMNTAPEHRCAALQTEPPGDEQSPSPKVKRTATTTNVHVQNVSSTNETAVQAYGSPTPPSPAPKTRPRRESPTSTKNGQTTMRSPSPAAPAKPSPIKEEPWPKNEPRPCTPPRTTPFTLQQVVLPPPAFPHATTSPPTPRTLSPLERQGCRYQRSTMTTAPNGGIPLQKGCPDTTSTSRCRNRAERRRENPVPPPVPHLCPRKPQCLLLCPSSPIIELSHQLLYLLELSAHLCLPQPPFCSPHLSSKVR